MTARLVLDECSWTAATGTDAGVLSNAIHQLLERLDVARQRNERVARHKDYYETGLGGDIKLFSALFDPDCPLGLDRDLAERFRLALDRMIEFDDSELTEYVVEFYGQVHFAPGIAWAHARCSRQCHAAVLPLPLEGVPRGSVPVAVADSTTRIVFITEGSGHVEFFRSLIVLEDADRARFERLAPSAFPALRWADNVWQGLGDFSWSYINVRAELVCCLGGLSDHGATCFHEHRADDPQRLPGFLSATVGTKVSDENGRTKRHGPSRRDRTRRHRGINKVFWWHVKLQPHADRIYFLYEPPSKSASPSEHGSIVVGIFKDHCIIPN